MYAVCVSVHVKPEFIVPFIEATLDNARNTRREPGQPALRRPAQRGGSQPLLPLRDLPQPGELRAAPGDGVLLPVAGRGDPVDGRTARRAQVHPSLLRRRRGGVNRGAPPGRDDRPPPIAQARVPPSSLPTSRSPRDRSSSAGAGFRELPGLAARFGSRVLLVTCPSALAPPPVRGRRPSRVLEKGLAGAGVSSVRFLVRSEPTTTLVDEGARLALAAGCEAVIGLGGGSVLDAAQGDRGADDERRRGARLPRGGRRGPLHREPGGAVHRRSDHRGHRRRGHPERGPGRAARAGQGLDPLDRTSCRRSPSWIRT